MRRTTVVLVSAAALAITAAYARAQQRGAMPPGHVHAPGMTHDAPVAAAPTGPRESGQSAFAAIAEIVVLLEQDSTTDWSKVDLDRLRRHLIDMEEVTLRATVEQRPIEGGIEAVVTGAGRTTDAIRRMTRSHSAVLAGRSRYRMPVEDVPDGVRVRITAAPGSEPAVAARIRGLGFIGIMTSEAHHGPHHVALARGVPVPGHAH